MILWRRGLVNGNRKWNAELCETWALNMDKIIININKMDKSNRVKKFTAQWSRSPKPCRCCEWYLPRLVLHKKLSWLYKKDFISQESKTLECQSQCSNIDLQFRLIWSSIFAVHILSENNGNDGGDIILGSSLSGRRCVNCLEDI